MNDHTATDTGPPPDLERELQVYHDRLDELLAHEGKYAIIKGDQIHESFFSAYDDALTRAYEIHKSGPFLVKLIGRIEKIDFITRSMETCHISPRQ